jgi:hypothetical protein
LTAVKSDTLGELKLSEKEEGEGKNSEVGRCHLMESLRMHSINGDTSRFQKSAVKKIIFLRPKKFRKL